MFWGILLRLDWEPLRGYVLAAGAASHACRRGSGSTRRFLFWGILLRLDWEPLREHGLTTGVVMRRRATTGVDGTRVNAL